MSGKRRQQEFPTVTRESRSVAGSEVRSCTVIGNTTEHRGQECVGRKGVHGVGIFLAQRGTAGNIAGLSCVRNEEKGGKSATYLQSGGRCVCKSRGNLSSVGRCVCREGGVCYLSTVGREEATLLLIYSREGRLGPSPAFHVSGGLRVCENMSISQSGNSARNVYGEKKSKLARMIGYMQKKTRYRRQGV